MDDCFGWAGGPKISGWRSHECERGTHEYVRHIATTIDIETKWESHQWDLTHEFQGAAEEGFEFRGGTLGLGAAHRGFGGGAIAAQVQ